MICRAVRAAARPSHPPSRRTGSSVRTPCRSTNTRAKRAARSRRCGRWRNSGTYALVRNAAAGRRGHSSAPPRSPEWTQPGVASSPRTSVTRAAEVSRRRPIPPAAAVACGGRRSQAHCLRPAVSSRRAARRLGAGGDRSNSPGRPQRWSSPSLWRVANAGLERKVLTLEGGPPW